MRITLGVVLFLNVWLGAVVPARQPQPRLVIGRVVDDQTGAGVAGAHVTLGPVARPATLGEFVDIPSVLPASGTRVITASDGRFLFRDVAPGRYSLGVETTDYLPASFGQARPGGPGMALEVADGPARSDIAIRLWRYASLSGVVVDDRGEPAVGVGVRCFIEVIAGGRRRLRASSGLPTTDDRGEFRVANLEPGNYVCGVPARYTTTEASPSPALPADLRRLQDSGSVTQQGESSGLRIGDHLLSAPGLARGILPTGPDASGRVLVCPTQFFPGVATTTTASRIALSPGEHRSDINFTVDLVPSTAVSGSVHGPDGPVVNLYLTLVPASGSDLVSELSAVLADTTTSAGGRFTLLGIPVGDYLLKARLFPRSPVVAAAAPPPPPDEPALWAVVPVSVGESPVTDLRVTLQTGARVIGRVVFEGQREPPPTAQVQRMSIRLQSAEGRVSSPIPADGRAAADGTFRTAGYPAGNYIVSVVASSVPQGWRLKAATYMGNDVSVDPFTLVDREVTGVVLTFTDRSTQLSGTVQGIERGTAAELIVFPADSTAWRTAGVAARRGRNERVDNDGAFSIGDLPPGEYFVAARPASSPGDWRDPAVLERLIRSATRVTLADGEQKRVDVKVVQQ